MKGYLGIMVLMVCLGGCDHGPSTTDIKKEIAVIKNRPPTTTPTLEPLPTYSAYPYTVAHLRSPFAANELENPSSSSEVDEPPQYLEQFPLDTLKMLGTLERGLERYALIEDKQGRVHRVGVGQHMGPHHGVVMEILADRLIIIEKMADHKGGFTERQISLYLQEGRK